MSILIYQMTLRRLDIFALKKRIMKIFIDLQA